MGWGSKLLCVTLVAVSLAGCAEGGRSVRSRWDIVRAPTPCADTRFVVYFDEGSDRLTAPARALIAETARVYRGCAIVDARVVGLADAVGTPESNLSLSQRRARRVAEALAAERLPAPRFELAAAGEAGAQLPGGREEPVRRRAEVFLNVKPR